MTSSRSRVAQRRAAARKRRTRLALAASVVVVIGVVAAVVIVVTRGSDGGGSGSGQGGYTGGDFHSLVADPTTPGRVFVGGHQAVSVSNDGGASWQRLEALDDVDAMGWGFVSEEIWISGHPGIVMSPDGGRTAARRNDALPDTDIHAFGADEELFYAAGPAVGVIVSRDEAATWRTVTAADGQAFFGRILIDPENDQHLLAADAARGPVESTDGGKTWVVLERFPVTWVSASDDLELLHASGPNGAVTSSDGGSTWRPVDVPSGVSLIEVDPHEPERLYAGAHDGSNVTVFVSDDEGQTWRQPSSIA